MKLDQRKETETGAVEAFINRWFLALLCAEAILNTALLWA